MRQRIKLAIDGPALDESISSFLDRAASFWGISRSAMAAAIGFGIEDEDPDAPSRKAIEALAEAAGFPSRVLENQVIEDGSAWLHSDRRVAYCPLCWRDDIEQGRAPYFRQRWALCSAVVCEEHCSLMRKWITDAGDRRLPPLVDGLHRDTDIFWQRDLDHANRFALTEPIRAIATFAHRASAAVVADDVWPDGWKGDASSCRALMQLLASNPSPLPERLAMDRLVPIDRDPMCFAGHRCATRGDSSSQSAFRRFGDPALRRTGWWLLARTLVPGWPPREIVGQYTTLIDAPAWWFQGVGTAVSDHARAAYLKLSHTLGFSPENH